MQGIKESVQGDGSMDGGISGFSSPCWLNYTFLKNIKMITDEAGEPEK